MLRICETPPDAEALRRAVSGPGCGAVVLFHGTVRDRTAGRGVTHLEYEAYAPMAVSEMERIAEEVKARHGLHALACAHRVGRLEVGETAVVVAASAPHRREALAAVDEFITRLKEDVPVWKKEHFEDGAAWASVDPRRGEGR